MPWRIILALCVAMLQGSVLGGEILERYTRYSDKAFAEVVMDLEFAISNRNYRVTGRNEIGSAIGEREQITFPRAAVLHFCNLTDAQLMLELAPEYLLHMPCRIAVRVHAGRIVVEARLLPEDHATAGALSRRINAILKAIVAEAVE